MRSWICSTGSSAALESRRALMLQGCCKDNLKGCFQIEKSLACKKSVGNCVPHTPFATARLNAAPGHTRRRVWPHLAPRRPASVCQNTPRGPS